MTEPVEIQGACHCGKVRFTVNQRPDWLMSCNCSICHRLGALWGHLESRHITIQAAPDSTLAYIQGDKLLAMHTCKLCGCTTHWENLDPGDDARMAVNFRMCERSVLDEFRVRHFDGANTWAYLD